MNDKFKDFIQRSVGYIIVVLACGVYIFTSILKIDKTGKTISGIIADGSITFLLGIFINRIFDLQEILNSERDERLLNAKDNHGKMVFDISPYIDRLDEWCERINRENYRMQRTKILARVGLKYGDCFDESGVAKDWQPNQENLKNKVFFKNEMKKLKEFQKAVNLKLTELTPNDLTSEGGKDSDPYWLGRTKAQYEAQQNAKDIISKIGMSVIFGYYGVTLITDFSWAVLLWHILQVVFFLAAGVISMYNTHNYLIGEYLGRIIKKTDILQKFKNDILHEFGKEKILFEQETEVNKNGD